MQAVHYTVQSECRH